MRATNNSVKERLISFLEAKSINKSEFGRRIGVSSAFITSMRQSMQPDKIERIALEFPELNMTWLLTGDGEMLNGETGCEQENTNPTNMNYDKFFQTIERRDRQFEELLSQTSRLIAVIERMQGIHPTGNQITPPIRVNNE